MSESAAEPDWAALDLLKEALLQDLRDLRIDHVEYVVQFVPAFDFWVWLGTVTDSERDLLSSDTELAQRVRRLAEHCGLESRVEGISIESKETVDREYDGSWFYRLR